MLRLEYSITDNTLKNVALVEYAKCFVENTQILPVWETQLRKDAFNRTVQALMAAQNLKVSIEDVKKALEKGSLQQATTNQASLIRCINSVNSIKPQEYSKPVTEETIKTLYTTCTNSPAIFRSTQMKSKVNADEILANIVSFTDWLNSLEAQDTHPLLVAGIIFAHIETIQPFSGTGLTNATLPMSMLIAHEFLTAHDYTLKDFTSFEDYLIKTRVRYERIMSHINPDEFDLTEWLEYFTELMALEASNIRERVKLLAKDTKVAKAAGLVRLTQRQEKIIEYLQDHGVLQNKDFKALFPEVSEDSILRDLKVLISKKVIIKSGSTKSSRYELK